METGVLPGHGAPAARPARRHGLCGPIYV